MVGGGSGFRHGVLGGKPTPKAGAIYRCGSRSRRPRAPSPSSTSMRRAAMSNFWSLVRPLAEPGRMAPWPPRSLPSRSSFTLVKPSLRSIFDLALLDVLQLALDLDALPAVLREVFVVVQPVEDAAGHRHGVGPRLGGGEHDVAAAPEEVRGGDHVRRGRARHAAADHEVVVGGRAASRRRASRGQPTEPFSFWSCALLLSRSNATCGPERQRPGSVQAVQAGIRGDSARATHLRDNRGPRKTGRSSAW